MGLAAVRLFSPPAIFPGACSGTWDNGGFGRNYTKFARCHNDHIFPYGAGNIGWAELVSALYEVGYEGLFNFEVPRENRCPMEIRLAKLDYAHRLAELMVNNANLE